jgi:hypothetical protein
MLDQSIVALLHAGERCGLVTIGLASLRLLAVQDARSVNCSSATCWGTVWSCDNGISQKCSLLTTGSPGCQVSQL